jgi:DNA-binding NarL/FixJ family response regulator
MNRIGLNGNFVIADRPSLVGRALKELLAGHGATVHSVAEKHALLSILRKQRTDLVIADYPLLFRDSLEDIPIVIRDYPETAHLVLTSTISKADIRSLDRYGLRNIVLKTDDRDEFIRSVRSALSGKPYYSCEVLDLLLMPDAKSAGEILLTPSELEITTLISGGLSIREIAARRQVSMKSVMGHRKSLFRKLGVTSDAELKLQAIRSGLIDNIEFHI